MSKSLSKTPAPAKDRIYGSKVNKQGSASSEKFATSIKLSSDIIVALTKKLKEFKETHNTKKVSLSDLKAVYRRGLGAYSSTHRPTISGGKPNTRNAWAMARVNAFLRKAGDGEAKKSYVQDDDLLKFNDGGEVDNSILNNAIKQVSSSFTKEVLPFTIIPSNRNQFVISVVNIRGAKEILIDYYFTKKTGKLVKSQTISISDSKFKAGGEVDEHKETYKKWKSLVNMSYSELKRFYDSEEGKQAGLKPSEAKAQGIDSGRESARWIMKMKKTPVSEWTPQMWKWANKQISFISRMSGMKGDLYDDKGRKTRKYLSLLIWGNDPEKYNSGGRIRKSIIEEIKEDLKNGISFSNNYAQFVRRKEGLMFRYDNITGKYKYYNDIDAFARAIFRFRNRGYAKGGETKGKTTYKDVVELLEKYQFRERKNVRDKRYKLWRNSTKVNGEEVDCFIDTEGKVIVLESQHGLKEIGYDLEFMESYFKKNRLKRNKYNDGGEIHQHTLWGVKNGEPDYAEVLLSTKKENFEKVKELATKDGYGRFRESKIDMREKPDFIKAIKKADGGTINQSINTNIMDEIKFNQLPHIDTISSNDKILIHESVFAGNLDKPKHIGERYIHCEVMGKGGMLNSLNLKVLNSVGANALRVGEVITRPVSNVLTKGRKLIAEPIANAMSSFKQGGLNPDNKEVKQYFAHDSGNAGGVLVGKRHSEGGIKAINKSTGQPLEMEGGEVVITRGAVSNQKKYQFQGKDMTTREILSKLNVDGGGVSFAEGGDVPDKMNCGCDKMDFGGSTMSVQDFINRSDSEYQEERLKAGVQKERNDHYDTLSKLNAGTITIDQALREIAQKEMKLDAKYPFAE